MHKPRGELLNIRPILHFVGFRGDEYPRAVRIFGRPDYIHFRWDTRARRDIHPLDTVVFAKGTDADPPSHFNGPDIAEPDDCA